MKITAVTRFKQGDIWRLLRKHGWTQAELARRSGMTQQALGKIINMILRPTEKQANAIQSAFAEVGEYIDVINLWPERFSGYPKPLCIEQTRDIEVEMLEVEESLADDYVKRLRRENHEGDLKSGMVEALSTLTDRQRAVLSLRWGVRNDEYAPRTLEHVGRILNLTRERVRQIEATAMRKMRHPQRKAMLQEHLRG